MWCCRQIERDKIVTIGDLVRAASGGFPELGAENVNWYNYSPCVSCPVALCAVTIAVVMYVGFPRSEPRFTLTGTLLLVYARLTRAPLVFLPPPMSAL